MRIIISMVDGLKRRLLRLKRDLALTTEIEMIDKVRLKSTVKLRTTATGPSVTFIKPVR